MEIGAEEFQKLYAEGKRPKLSEEINEFPSDCVASRLVIPHIKYPEIIQPASHTLVNKCKMGYFGPELARRMYYVDENGVNRENGSDNVLPAVVEEPKITRPREDGVCNYSCVVL